MSGRTRTADDPAPWVTDENAALLTDLYQLTMLQAYWREGMSGEAVFSLYFRTLPPARNFMLFAGLGAVLRYLERLRFHTDALDYLASLGLFCDAFLRSLETLRFRGDVWAVPEGTPVFSNAPLLEIAAPIAEAQLAESFVMNQIHVQTVLASKAARVVAAAQGRPVVDFGLRRMHGADAALKGARAYHVAGIEATSNLLAGRVFDLPVAGTMAHSYVQAHDREADAFRAFTGLYPETILLVDSYDTLAGVRRVVELARELGAAFRVRGVRLDSGDLGALAREARRILDQAGLAGVEIFASGSLDEYRVAELVQGGAPIDAFGVGTRMGVSADAPDLDLVYKLTAYAGTGRVKTSPGKELLPGRKQVFRFEEDDLAVRDVLATCDEVHPGRPLLEPVLRRGERLDAGRASLADARARAAAELARLPERLRALEPAAPPYPVVVSERLRAEQLRVRTRVADA